MAAEVDGRHWSQLSLSVECVQQPTGVPSCISPRYMGCSGIEGLALFRGGQGDWVDENQTGCRLFVSENWVPQSHADKPDQLDIQLYN